MDADSFGTVEKYMLECMAEDTAHGKDHIYHVLYGALLIAEDFEEVDYDCLIVSCLLHDIGREEQLRNPKLCHAEVGAQKAERFLLSCGYSDSFAAKVSDCIKTHRFRKGQTPKTIEAKILFDADKLDVTGAIGIARTLAYKGLHGTSLYEIDSDGSVSGGENDSSDTFFHEYKFKLEGMYDRFYTKRGSELAAERRKAAEDFYEAVLNEVRNVTLCSRHLLNGKIE
ncbi:MAG: HD domain-containing protein [Methanocorpusculum sp.]|nr:HD domain-containing protein [Methanocorpusculum sp.]